MLQNVFAGLRRRVINKQNCVVKFIQLYQKCHMQKFWNNRVNWSSGHQFYSVPIVRWMDLIKITYRLRIDTILVRKDTLFCQFWNITIINRRRESNLSNNVIFYLIHSYSCTWLDTATITIFIMYLTNFFEPYFFLR